MEYYIRIMYKNQTTRIIGGSHSHAGILRDKFAALGTARGVVVDPRVYSYEGSLVRSASEERAALRLLDLILGARPKS